MEESKKSPGFFIPILIVVIIVVYVAYTLTRIAEQGNKPSQQATAIEIPKTIVLPTGKRLSSLELADGTYTTVDGNTKTDTIKIFDSKLKTFENAPPKLEKKLVYIIIEH